MPRKLHDLLSYHYRSEGGGVQGLTGNISKVECGECSLRFVCPSMQYLTDSKTFLKQQ